MDSTRENITVPALDFSPTAFNRLMQKRIRQVLLICSNYDYFMLEEDGRIDEQIFNEYVSLNLRYPPVFMRVSTAREAFAFLERKQVDLVIQMLNIEDIDTFELARQIKEKNPGIPIVTLTHFSREVSMRLQDEDLSAIDYVFCWLGNADLLLAIVKLIEDKMNAEHDVEEIGVQTILMVEDSIRYISSYLPSLYKIIYKQSREFSVEAVNEHQRMLRMRGRPKVLLATNYDDAVKIYQKYKHNMLGIISDVNFKKNPGAKVKGKYGIDFCKLVKAEDRFMPFLLQSSNAGIIEEANKLGIGFLYKFSKNLTNELNEYIVGHFAFGDFIFRNPDTQKEVSRAADLQAFQSEILKIPDDVLAFHTSRNDFSKWLNARAIFPIAQIFKRLTIDDFKNLDSVRQYIHESISNYRISKNRGIIAKFEKEKFDEYKLFSRIGEGSIGGKARGLAFINSMIESHRIFNKYPNIVITIPRTVVLGTDVFDQFMEDNKLYSVALSDASDEKILNRFVGADLPAWIEQDIRTLLEVIVNPIAVRSSSKLEDSHYQPFAGIYSTYMVPCNKKDREDTMRMLLIAIKSVYASVYFKSSKAYMAATSNVIDEEKMGIILQEVCGTEYRGRFYPAISGVARSINFYPIEPEKPEDGISVIAYGLGKFLMEGGTGLRFSPKYPRKVLQLSSPETILGSTQKAFYAIDMNPSSFVPSVDDGMNLFKLKFDEAEKDASFRFAASTYDLQNRMIREGITGQGKRVATFSQVLNYNAFPLSEIISELLHLSRKEMSNHIEMEFAVNLPEGRPAVFNYLQIRPIVLNEQSISFNLNDVKQEDAIVYSESALGNGSFTGLRDIIYIRPASYKPSKSKEIAGMVEKINNEFIRGNGNYILIGPGRWGSTDPWLGIPAKWPQLSAARVIVEAGQENYRIDPSQGTHFFQNITSFGVGYFTINPHVQDGCYDLPFLDRQPACFENEFIRHVRFEEDLRVRVDGRSNRGVIYKPGS